ncbi:MAG: LURP-one-related family protein [Alkalibacterium sp.]|nr:LURP-one-related family protein [Alkalibacterium sp.]
MRLFIKQQVFSLNDKFSVKDENEADRFYVEGQFMALGKKLRVYTPNHQEVLYIEQQLWKLLPEYDLFSGEDKVATIKKEFDFFKNNYTIHGPDWNIEGSITAHDYVIKSQGKIIADINKKFLSWGDTYEIIIHDESQLHLLLGIVIVIDCVISASRTSNN